MKERFLTFFMIVSLGIFLAPISCTQSPSLLQDTGGEAPPTANALTPPGDRPVIPSDSGPQGVWHCKEYLYDNPEKYKPEDMPEDCRRYILPNARDAINTNKVEIPVRIIPTLGEKVEDTVDPILTAEPVLINIEQLEELQRYARPDVILMVQP